MTNRILLSIPGPVTLSVPKAAGSSPPTHKPDGDGFDPTEPLVVTVREAGKMLRLGRSTVFELLRTNQLERRHIGGSTRVTVASIRKLAGV